MAKDIKKKEIILILHEIRSAYNVGSIFRTADATGVSKIYLSGYTPAPIDQFKKENKMISKTALGAEKLIPWERISSTTKLIVKLKKEGMEIIALEQSEKSIDYRKFKPKNKIALILGNEVQGMPKSVLNKCDKIIEIPMKGEKESLNVSVATGVALFELIRNFFN